MSAVTHLLIHTAQHKQKARQSQGKGKFKETLPVVATPNCRFNPANSKERDIGAQAKAVVTHSIYLEPELEVKVNDEFTGTAPSEWAGRTFRVTVPALRPSVPNTYLKVLCEEVQSG